MLIDGQKIILQRWQVEEILDKRKSTLGDNFKISDFFMILSSPNQYEWDSEIETKYGKLRAFCVDPKKLSNHLGVPGARILLLHKSKFDYPEISPFKNEIKN